jgi:hypothetical protein
MVEQETIRAMLDEREMRRRAGVIANIVWVPDIHDSKSTMQGNKNQ